MQDRNLEIVLEETRELLRNQQDGIDLLYNKLNWILVSNIVLLATLFSFRGQNFIVVALLIVSIIIILTGFNPRTFKITAKISDQLKLHEDGRFLKSLITKKKEAYLANNKRITMVHQILKRSSYCLIGALVVQFLMIYVC